MQTIDIPEEASHRIWLAHSLLSDVRQLLAATTPEDVLQDLARSYRSRRPRTADQDVYHEVRSSLIGIKREATRIFRGIKDLSWGDRQSLTEPLYTPTTARATYQQLRLDFSAGVGSLDALLVELEGEQPTSHHRDTSPGPTGPDFDELMRRLDEG